MGKKEKKQVNKPITRIISEWDECYMNNGKYL